MSNRATGFDYERRAADYLASLGMEILGRNYYWRHGEIDIIAKDNDYLVFVEVKYRKNTKYGNPYEAVDFRKKNRIRSGARVYMMDKHIPFSTPCRFDIISITEKEVLYFKDAF